MHLAIVGAGALGCVYGARLTKKGAGVTLVVRPARVGETKKLRFERVDVDEHLEWAPERAAAIPGNADVVMVCVRNEQLDDALLALLAAAPEVPVVVMTPMLPQDFARMQKALGERVLSGMPGVVAYENAHGAIRYWLPRSADTLIEETRPTPEIVAELVREIDGAGIAARLELGVHELNPATTVSFLPLVFALDLAGTVDALLEDSALVDLALRGKDEGADLAHTIGRVAGWAGLLLKFAGHMTLKIGIGLARRSSPEAFAYVEEHFGHKLHVQNVAMAEKIVALAEEKGTPREALGELAARLKAK